MKTLVVNLYGGPGTGKSTTMAGVFSLCKLEGMNAEMAPEFAKETVWEQRLHTMNNQLYLFAKQHMRIWRLLNQVDVIVTDSPFLLSLYYGQGSSQSFANLVDEEYQKLWTLDVFLKRLKPYNPNGRLQTQSEAIEIDEALREILFGHTTRYVEVDADEHAPSVIFGLVHMALGLGERMKLSATGQRLFIETLLNPPPVGGALAAAAARYKDRVRKGPA
jgi:hypothetical protein